MKKQSQCLFSLILIIVTINFVSAVTITDISNYPSPYNTSNSSILFNYNISTDYLNQTIWSWDGTNYSLYDNSLVLDLQMNNFSSLGEYFNSTGCLINDVSKYENNGSCVGGTNLSLGTDRFGNLGGVNFSGNWSYINASNTLVNNSNFTISLWFKIPARDTVNIRGLISTQTITDYNNKIGYSLNIDTNGVLRFYAGNATTLQDSRTPTSTNYGDNTWHNAVLNYDGSYLNIFIDGIENDASKHSPLIGFNNSYSSLHIGDYAYQTGTVRNMNGSIDDVKIWNRTLSSNEILENYNTNKIKYDSQNWSISINQSLSSILNSTTTLHNYPYYFCSSNSTIQVCSSNKIITQSIQVKNIISNFTNIIGNVRSDFYGVQSSGAYFTGGFGGSYDYTWQRARFLESGMKYMRVSTNLNYASTSEGVFDSTYSKSYSDLVSWAKSNNIKILFVFRQMPNWLANQTTGWCNVSNQVNANFTCPPSNYTKWGNLVVDFLNNVSCDSNTCEVEVWNEPNLAEYWLNNLSTRTNGNISIEYNKLYNATYLAVKALNSSYQVGGIATTYTTGTAATGMITMISNWMSNFSNQIDFVSQHDYLFNNGRTTTDYHTDLLSVYSMIYGNITANNVNTTRIIIGEFNVWNNTMIYNYSNQWAMQLGLVYEVTLNNYPANISTAQYQWTYNDYLPVDYNGAFSMVSDPAFNNTLRASYNLTKSFATYCPSSSTVYQSSSDDSTVKTVSCVSGTMDQYHGSSFRLIVINTDTNSKNITVNTLNSNGTLVDSEGNIYNVLNGQSNLGILDSYEIMYLQGVDNLNPTDSINSICEQGGLTFSEAITLIGIIMTVLFISSVLGILVLVFSNVIDLDRVKEKVDLNKLLIGVMIIGLTGLILATMAYVLINGFCGLI